MFLVKICGAQVPEMNDCAFEQARSLIKEKLLTIPNGTRLENREVSVKFLGEHPTSEDIITAEIDCHYDDVLNKADEFAETVLNVLCELFHANQIFVEFNHNGQTLSEAHAPALA